MSGQGKQMPGMVARDTAHDGGATPVEATARPAAADGDAFDAWLRDELGRLYGATLQEPVPDDMLRLLQAAARKG